MRRGNSCLMPAGCSYSDGARINIVRGLFGGSAGVEISSWRSNRSELFLKVRWMFSLQQLNLLAAAIHLLTLTNTTLKQFFTHPQREITFSPARLPSLPPTWGRSAGSAGPERNAQFKDTLKPPCSALWPALCVNRHETTGVSASWNRPNRHFHWQVSLH